MTAQQLIQSGRRYVYWLDLSVKPVDGKHRVSLVFENETGHFPTGTAEMQEPWYWSDEICKSKNKELEYSEQEVLDIVCSSMFPKG